MNKFGWDYPPGCSGPPEYGPDPSDLEEEVLAVLENSRLSQERQDKILKLLSELEREQGIEDEAKIEASQLKEPADER